MDVKGGGILVTWIILAALLIYVLAIYPYYRFAQKAGLSWAWAAFIPYGSAFITAKLVDWPIWWIYPVALLVLSWIPVVGEILGVLFLIMSAIMLYRFRGGWGWIFINFVPVVGTIVFMIVLYVIALGEQYRYHPREL